MQFQLQLFDIICSTSWANRDKCCELPGLVSPYFSYHGRGICAGLAPGHDACPSPDSDIGPGADPGSCSCPSAGPTAMCLLSASPQFLLCVLSFNLSGPGPTGD